MMTISFYGWFLYRFDFPSVLIIYMTIVMMVICKCMNSIIVQLSM